ncbi:hypothetical protein [Loigolactobacillus jiayinensis]|uniref:Uncharacterized protein n=1 Tax=Loigolactobacillus jiayinensis TaxID=2486016 RepID=A0ABW1R948_9LACO|nr:hypothetical protein [Loigolactobacillus jiayinensis]
MTGLNALNTPLPQCYNKYLGEFDKWKSAGKANPAANRQTCGYGWVGSAQRPVMVAT